MESNQDQINKPYMQLDIRIYQPQQVNSSCKESSDNPTSGKRLVSAVSKDVMQYLQLETVLYKQQPSKHFPRLDIRTYQPQQGDTSRKESYDDPSSGKELVSTMDKVRSGAVYHALAKFEDQHVKETADSIVLLNWIFNKLDPKPGILSMINCHMAGENLAVKGFNVNLTRVQIAERRVTPPDPVVMVTFSLENVMPVFVGESNLGPKFVIPGAAYHNTIEDTLHVINTTVNCDTPSDTESAFRTALLSAMKIQALKSTTSYPPD